VFFGIQQRSGETTKNYNLMCCPENVHNAETKKGFESTSLTEKLFYKHEKFLYHSRLVSVGKFSNIYFLSCLNTFEPIYVACS
jgi:hypothetical protein